MRTLASYADKDKENVYETPGFNKTKNPTLIDLFINLVYFIFSSTYTMLAVFS